MESLFFVRAEKDWVAPRWARRGDGRFFHVSVGFPRLKIDGAHEKWGGFRLSIFGDDRRFPRIKRVPVNRPSGFTGEIQNISRARSAGDRRDGSRISIRLVPGISPRKWPRNCWTRPSPGTTPPMPGEKPCSLWMIVDGFSRPIAIPFKGRKSAGTGIRSTKNASPGEFRPGCSGNSRNGESCPQPGTKSCWGVPNEPNFWRRRHLRHQGFPAGGWSERRFPDGERNLDRLGNPGEGRNLRERTQRGRETFHEAIHWPAIFPARWLVRHLGGCSRRNGGQFPFSGETRWRSAGTWTSGYWIWPRAKTKAKRRRSWKPGIVSWPPIR